MNLQYLNDQDGWRYVEVDADGNVGRVIFAENQPIPTALADELAARLSLMGLCALNPFLPLTASTRKAFANLSVEDEIREFGDMYLGVKVVRARPETLSQAEQLLNRKIPTNGASASEEGYLVTYADRYRSWSPRLTFEQANAKFLSDTVSLDEASLIQRAILMSYAGKR